MRSGELKHRLAVQVKTMAENAQRQLVPTWATSFYIRAKVEQLTGGEEHVNRAAEGIKTYDISIWYHNQITRENRLVYGSETLDILDIESVKPLRELKLLARTSKNG